MSETMYQLHPYPLLGRVGSSSVTPLIFTSLCKSGDRSGILRGKNVTPIAAKVGAVSFVQDDDGVFDV